MGKRTKLYLTLLEMLDAAEANSEERVIALNERFIPEYHRVMPRHYNHDSIADLYDRVGNKLLGTIDDNMTSKEKKEELKEAKKIISRIKKSERY